MYGTVNQGGAKRQQFGVAPDERHSLSEWQNAGTWYPELFGDVREAHMPQM